jgi:hypothetical protein
MLQIIGPNTEVLNDAAPEDLRSFIRATEIIIQGRMVRDTMSAAGREVCEVRAWAGVLEGFVQEYEYLI